MKTRDAAYLERLVIFEQPLERVLQQGPVRARSVRRETGCELL